MKYFVIPVILAILIAGCSCMKQEKIVAASTMKGTATNYSSSTAPGEPKIIETVRQADGSVKITWRSEKGAKYEVLSTTSTDASKAEWKIEAAVDASEGETTSWTDAKAGESTAKLYKIRKIEKTG